MITATTAPSPPKRSRFILTSVTITVENSQMVTVYRIENEVGGVIGERSTYSTPTDRTGLAYDATGNVVETAPVASTLAFLGADFAAFANTAGTAAVKAAALETRHQATGRIPT